MIETPLDILSRRRETFVKSLYDCIGITEAADEYLEAYNTITKANLYYSKPSLEPLLLYLAKAEGDTAIYDTSGNLSRAAGAMGDPEEIERMNTLYQGQLQYSSEFANTFDMSQPVHTNPYLAHLHEEVEHTFTDGTKKMVPKYIAHNFLYYTPQEELGGISQAEYDNRRLLGMEKHAKANPDQVDVFSEGIFHNIHSHQEDPTIKHHSNFGRGFESPLHMLESNYLEGDVPELKDVLLGITHIPEGARKRLYKKILERGGIDKGQEEDRDSDGNHSFEGVPLGRMIISLHKKAQPLYRALLRPERFGGDLQIGRKENLPSDETMKPRALYNAMRPDQLINYHLNILRHLGVLDQYKEGIDKLADEFFASGYDSSPEAARIHAEEIYGRQFDLPKYDAKNNKFSVKRLDKQPSTAYDWHSSVSANNLSLKGIAAAFHYDIDKRQYYPLGGNPSGVEFDKNIAIAPKDIREILDNAERVKKDYYKQKELKGNNISISEPYVHDDHMEEFMEDDNRGLGHFWGKLFNGIGGIGLLPNNALLLLAHIFEHPLPEEEKSRYMQAYSDANDALERFDLDGLAKRKKELEDITVHSEMNDEIAEAEKGLKEIEEEIKLINHYRSIRDHNKIKLMGARNLLIDYNHPDDKSSYIHPKGEVSNLRLESKGYGGATNALAFASQQQQHIVTRPVFDPIAVAIHKRNVEEGKPSTHPIATGFVKVPRNAPASSLKFGYRPDMDPLDRMEAEAADMVRDNTVSAFGLGIGVPAHMGITRGGHELKQIPLTFTTNAQHLDARMGGHLKDMKVDLGLPSLKDRKPDDPTYSGKLQTPNKNVLRNRGDTSVIHDSHLFANVAIQHKGDVEHHDRMNHQNEVDSFLRGLMGGEGNSPLFPQEEHTLDFDDPRMIHHGGHKLITDLLRRDPAFVTLNQKEVSDKQDNLDYLTAQIEQSRDYLRGLIPEMHDIEWKLNQRENPQHVRNLQEREALQNRLNKISKEINEGIQQRQIARQLKTDLATLPRFNVKQLLDKVNEIIDGSKGLPHNELSDELQRLIANPERSLGFKRTLVREGKLKKKIDADKSALTQMAADERNKWIDSQGLSFGDPNNIQRYLGNLAVYMKAMERRLVSEDTGGKYYTLQSHHGVDSGTGESKTHTGMHPISPQINMSGVGPFVYYNHNSVEGKKFGFEADIKPIYNSHGVLVRFEQVEPYDFLSKTLTRPMYKQVGHEYEARWGPSMDSKIPYADESMFGGGRQMVRKQEDATILLASLSNPDILLKKDGEYPTLQPMHRIFKLEDLEHLRGFSGDWIVSAMPEGPRAFVEKKDDKITVRGDFDLDDDTKKNFSKISKKDFVVDVVLAGKEYNVIDIVEYDDSSVHDMSLQERIKILRGTMESTENVLLPAAHNLRLTDDVGLEVIVKDLLKEHSRLVLRDANSTYMKGESRHPKWVLYDEGQDVNLMVLDKKGTSSFTYRLGTGPITHEDSLGDRAVEYEGDTYMDVGTSFQSKDSYEVGDIVTVNVDSISVTENTEGADIYTVNSNEIKGEAEGEGVSSVETLSMFTKSEPTMWPHEIDRDGDRIVIKMDAGDVSYRASEIDGEWYMFNPKADNTWLIRLSESQRPFWSSVAGVMLKADLSLYDDESKAEVHESKNDAKPLIPPKKVKNTNFWDSDIDDAVEHKKKVKRLLAKSLRLASSMLKSGVGAVGDSSTGAMGLGIDYATPIESPSGPTSLVGSKTMPDHDARDIERDNKERLKDKKMGYREPVDDEEEGEMSIDKDKAAFVPY